MLISGRIGSFINVVIKLTTFNLPLFYKKIPNVLPCFDIVTQTLGIMLDVPKAEHTRPGIPVFFTLLVSQCPECLNHSVQTRKSIWYFSNNQCHL